MVQQLGVQRAQFGSGVGTEAGGEQGAHLLVRGEGLRGAAGSVQGADAECLERLVERVVGAEGDQFGQRLLGAAEREVRAPRARRAASRRASQRAVTAARSGRSAKAGPCHRARAASRASSAFAPSPASSARLPSP